MWVPKPLANIFPGDGEIPLAAHVVLRDWGQERSYYGVEAVLGFLNALFCEGFGKVRAEPESALSSQDWSYVAFTFKGVHQAPFLGIPPSGREVCLPMLICGRTVEEELVAVTLYYNAGTLLRQLGLYVNEDG